MNGEGRGIAIAIITVGVIVIVMAFAKYLDDILIEIREVRRLLEKGGKQ